MLCARERARLTLQGCLQKASVRESTEFHAGGVDARYVERGEVASDLLYLGLGEVGRGDELMGLPRLLLRGPSLGGYESLLAGGIAWQKFQCDLLPAVPDACALHILERDGAADESVLSLVNLGDLVCCIIRTGKDG